MATMRLAGLSARSQLYVRQTMGALLARAERQGLVSRNVARLVEPVGRAPQAIRVLTPEQVKVLLDATDRDPLFTVAISTGARQSELAGLRWSDVDFEKRTVRISRSLQYRDRLGWTELPTKTHKSTREIVLPEVALRALERQKVVQDGLRRSAREWHIEHGDLVFTASDGRPVPGTAVTKRLQRTLRELGLPAVSFHSLRHTCASLLAASGVPLLDVSRQLGHSDIGITANIYSEWFDKGRRNVANAMDLALGASQ